MARQAIASLGSLQPVFVNETLTNQAITAAPVYVDQTIQVFNPAWARGKNIVVEGVAT